MHTYLCYHKYNIFSFERISHFAQEFWKGGAIYQISGKYMWILKEQDNQ